ncbi:cytochrome P450 [Halococcoides cellulosivorans]|uniref:Cytochrome P450 n=1 Tax=Halococcoides cellulosivorans TaxID=1679096 RepID=A0A2R4WZJ9_9EURY|nr:cytochrome P450 [Halococcoides cellulosivorans]AWB26969.1 cytochrome P450 [Halococcoides cellulosivorans]
MATDDRATAADDPENYPLPPGPDGWPLIGQTFAISRDFRTAYEQRLVPHGDVVRYTFVGRRWVTVIHPDHVQRVLLDDWESFGKYGFEDFGGEFASEGVLFAEGEQWRSQREAMQDAFTIDRIQGYADAMTRFTADLVDSWAEGDVVAIDEAFADLTLRILCHSLFDLDVAAEAQIVGEFTASMNEISRPSGLTSYLPLWVPTPENRRYKRLLDAFREFVVELIDRRRGRAEEFDDLLSMMLVAEDDAGRTMSETELRDQMVTFLFAGHETTALALSFALLEIANSDAVRERLDAEYEAVLDDRDPTPTTMGRLDATDRVIREALRLYPPAYIQFRRATEDVVIDGYRIPEGTRMTIPQFHIHRDERWYDDPEQFRPERWTDEFEDELHDYAYFPFGGGPRHCIGMRFAMMELKHVLPVLLRRVEFDLVSDPEPDLDPAATLHPADPIEMRISKR